MTTIKLDLDGVCSDFEGGFYQFFGKLHNSMPDSEMWRTIDSKEDFWVNLPEMPDFKLLWDFIKDNDITILTGCPRKPAFYVAQKGKKEWVKTHIGDVPIICCMSKFKQNYMTKRGDILIDDNAENCKRWVNSGGRAIFHSSAENTIEQLKLLEL